jgi:dienelactone hydrolase
VRLHTYIGSDAYRAGERFMLITQRWDYIDPGYLPACLYSTGYTGRPDFANRSTVMDRPISQLVPKTHSFLSIESGGTATFGNDTAIQAIEQAVAWSEAQGRTGPFLFAGTSMGAMDMLNYIRTHQDKVAAFVGFTPGVNLSGAVAENRQGLAAAANAAYGGAYSAAVHGPTHDPTTFAGELNVPIMLLCSSNDTLTTSADCAAFVGNAPNAIGIDLGPVGDHNQAAVAAACARQELHDFIAAHTP